ncbi:PD-(D/E)XK nuclease family protein [Parapedobacter sp.]
MERHIGRIDYEQKLGGRVDIEIRNDKGVTICIENKIYAGDQHGQIMRYCAYNAGKNTVLYLTLDGSEPCEGSKGELEAGKDFFCISYKNHMLKWLQECLAYSAEEPYYESR